MQPVRAGLVGESVEIDDAGIGSRRQLLEPDRSVADRFAIAGVDHQCAALQDIVRAQLGSVAGYGAFELAQSAEGVEWRDGGSGEGVVDAVERAPRQRLVRRQRDEEADLDAVLLTHVEALKL